MRVQSFIEEKNELVKVEVEVALWPGLPAIHFLGRADQNLKESSLRIKSAIKAAGFDFPVAQQIVVNLRPTHLPKSSRGIELAVAAAYLWMTDQVPSPAVVDDLYVYGELSLFGDVSAPESLRRLKCGEQSIVVTGGPGRESFPFKCWRASNLKTLRTPEILASAENLIEIQRPAVVDRMLFSETEAELLSMLAVGRHHVLLAGPSGSGKSTLARALTGLLPTPSNDEMFEIQKLNPGLDWRPVIEPHHSTPRMAMIGGGASPYPGEITRAHRGVLLLDEFLEFDRMVLESLREPFEQGFMRVGRLGGVEIFPADIQIMGTTNLCPCGSYVPGEKSLVRCRFSLMKCRSYSSRISGPLLDRYHIVYFSSKRNERVVEGSEILARVARAFEFQRKRTAGRAGASERTVEVSGGVRGVIKSNSFLNEKDLRENMDETLKAVGFSSRTGSQRRSLATLRVARTLADLAQKPLIGMEEVDRAMKWTIEPFERLERWD